MKSKQHKKEKIISEILIESNRVMHLEKSVLVEFFESKEGYGIRIVKKITQEYEKKVRELLEGEGKGVKGKG